KAGGGYLPIEADLPSERLQFILADSGAKVLIIDSEKLFELEGYEGELFAADVQLPQLETSDTPVTNPEIEIRPPDLAYMIYTSGSTGQPKGCEIEHRSLANFLTSAISNFWSEPFEGTQGTQALFTPVSFDFTIMSLFCPLLRGKSIVVYPQSASMEDILRDQFSAQSPVDTIKVTPSHIRMLESLD